MGTTPADPAPSPAELAAAYVEEATDHTPAAPGVVPVTVTDPVRTTPTAPHSMTTGAFALADGIPAQLSSDHQGRRRLVVANLDTAATVFVASDPALATTTSGHAIGPGGSLEVFARGHVHAAAFLADGTTPAAAVAVTVLAEYGDG